MRYSTIAIGVIFLFGVIPVLPLRAQYSTYNYVEGVDQNAIPSASSILTNQPVYGRFGKTESGGFLSPSPNENTRLNTGAFFSQSGGFIGLNNNTSNSRFQPYWEQSSSTAPPSDPNEILDLLRNRKIRDQAKADQIEREAPKSVQATPQVPIPFNRSGNGTAYYSSGEHASDFGSSSAQDPQNHQEYQRSTSPDSRQGTWIRSPGAGGSSGRPEPVPPRTSPDGSREVDLGSRFAGNIALSSNNMPESANTANGPQAGMPVPAPLLPAQDPRVSFQEYLELMILRSPKVNPLSPIQVLFNNGTATIRGIVPSQEHRLEAGRILLSDSRVQKVDNRLTVLPSNFEQPLPAPFDPNMPK
ncbi:MAG: BON domain-containing protein [Planctomycetia bacterium]|nr:BON domain-containing protein [Planctomycetia bacterium]